MSENIVSPYSKLKKILLIINPVSGRGNAHRHLADIVRVFSEYGCAVTVFITKKCGDAEAYARLYSPDFDTVVCMGGDGTLNETVFGLYKSGADIPLGYIPCGSTNDFAACHGISSDVKTAVQNIALGSVSDLDLGCFGSRIFAYVAAFGAFSWLSYNTPQNLKNALGHSAYYLDAIKDIPKLKAEHLKFETERFSCEGNYIFGAICNTTSVARTIYFPENAVDTCDGKFEVLLVHEPNSIADFQSILYGVLNKDYSSPFLDFFHASALEITAPDGLEWSVDGERYVGCAQIPVRNIHKGLKLLA